MICLTGFVCFELLPTVFILADDRRYLIPIQNLLLKDRVLTLLTLPLSNDALSVSQFLKVKFKSTIDALHRLKHDEAWFGLG
jgi:hypothetical protein